jgi:hypothetical protein
MHGTYNVKFDFTYLAYGK